MRSLQDWLIEYARTHRNPRNQAIHVVCVPAIFVSLIGLLSAVRIVPIEFMPTAAFVPAPAITAAWVLIAVAAIFYWRLSKRYAAIMVPMACLVSALSRWALDFWGPSWIWVCAAVFALAWVGQFVGHRIEGAKPAFFDDLGFLFIGPIWVVQEIRAKREVA